MRAAALFAQSIADETRWRILLLLWEQPLCVCELADILDMKQSSVSSHVQVIRRADLLESERREKWIYYRVARTALPLLNALRKHFDLHPESVSALARDEKRMIKRLAEREKSCCPAPKELALKTRKRRAALHPNSNLMTTHELHTLLTSNGSLPLRLMLPEGGVVPVSFHITEVGRVHKSFIDCGGRQHETTTCQLQAWVGQDDDHRLTALKLATILGKGAAAFGDDDLPVEIEYEDGVISQYPLSGVTRDDNALIFHLTTKHTDCLAKELCGLPASDATDSQGESGAAASCCGSTGGCGR